MPARCPTCDSVYDDATTYCVLDGTRLTKAPGPNPALPNPPSPDLAPAPIPAPASAPAPARGASSSLVIGALAGLVVLLGGALALLALRPAPPAPVQTETAPMVSGVDAPEDRETEADPAEAQPDRALVSVGTAEPRRSAAMYGPARIDTDGAGLLLRGGPGRDYEVVGKMLPDDVVTVDGCDDGRPGRRWCTVVYGGVRGYALDEFLDIGGPSQDTDSGLEQAFASSDPVGQWAIVDGSEASFVHLRSQPFVGGEILTRMEPGASVRVVRCLPYGWSLGGRAIEGRWCFVNAEAGGRSISGWASDGALRW